jgi:hypothetical protein
VINVEDDRTVKNVNWSGYGKQKLGPKTVINEVFFM